MDYEFPLLFVKEGKVTHLRDRGGCLQVFLLKFNFPKHQCFSIGGTNYDSFILTHKKNFSLHFNMCIFLPGRLTNIKCKNCAEEKAFNEE